MPKRDTSNDRGRGSSNTASGPVDADAPVIRPQRVGPLRWLWTAPLMRVLAYYVVMIGVGVVLVTYVPAVRRALVTPVVPVLGEGMALVTGTTPPPSWGVEPALLPSTLERALTTLLVALGAIAVAVPVAWVYMLTKRLRFDPALVRSVIILPIAVTGILLVVKNSLAIAFSLAGIVAAVRFRNTLKDPRDAVYIFLAIAIGIAAGVQALDVALVISILFNLAVLVLWKYRVGSVYGRRYEQTGVLSSGASPLLLAQTPEQRRELRLQLLEEASEMRTDGILLVHTARPEVVRHTMQDLLVEMAKEWRLSRIVPRGDELVTLEFLLRLKKKVSPNELLGALDEWSSQVAAAEYIPFRARQRRRGNGKKEKAENGDDD